jgi:hypothetical protein
VTPRTLLRWHRALGRYVRPGSSADRSAPSAVPETAPGSDRRRGSRQPSQARRQLPQLRRQHRLPQTLPHRPLALHPAPPKVAGFQQPRTAAGRTAPATVPTFRGK